MKRPTVTVTLPARKVGRPRTVSASDEPPAVVHISFDPHDYDFAYAHAAREDISVPEVIRRAFKDWRGRQHPSEKNGPGG